MAPDKKKKSAPAVKKSPPAKPGPRMPVEELEKASLRASKNGRNAPEKQL